MKVKILLSLVVSVLALAAPAFADHYPNTNQMPEVMALAHRVADTAEHVHLQAERESYGQYGNYGQQQAIISLH